MFKCPMCESTSYSVVQVRQRDGHYKDTSLFKCSRCSVVFHDPEAFTNGKNGPNGRMKIINRPGGRLTED
jgi:uncharacterized C2H2 Zn-finger protein